MSNIPIQNPFSLKGNQITNLDAIYGPYSAEGNTTAKQKALLEIGEDGYDRVVAGLTVGIVENGEIVEYWLQKTNDDNPDIEDSKSQGYNLVKKQASIEVDSEPEEGSPKAVSSGGVYTALQEKASISDIPDISKNITDDANSDTKATSPKAVKTYVDNSLTNKQNIINKDDKLSADLVKDGEFNKVVTQLEKDIWNNPLAKVTFVGTNEITGFPDVANPEGNIIYACLKLIQDQGINSAYNFYIYKEGNWQNISQGPKGDGNFTFIKFSEDMPLQDSDIHDNFNPSSDRYIGVYNGLLSEAPTNYQSYNWGKFNGESALEIYNKLHSEDTPLTEAEFIDMLKATYPMKYVGYDDTAAAANVGDELNSLDGNTAGSTYEHGLYLMPNANPDNDTPTGSVLFICVNKGENNYKWVKMGNMNTPNNLVTKEDIVDNVETGGSEKVLSAQQGKVLGWKTQLADATEEKVEVTNEMIVPGKYVHTVYSSTSFPGNIISAPSNNITIIPLDGTEQYLRFNGVGVSAKSIGCAFYDDNIDEDHPNGHTVYSLGFTSIIKEYIVKVPYGAVRFITTSRRGSLSQSDFYCYKIYGKPLDKPSSDADVVIKQDDDIAKMIVKMGGLKDISLTKLPFYFRIKGAWNAENNSINTATTTYSVDYINVEGYDKVAFLGMVYEDETNRGYGFADNIVNDTPINPISTAWEHDGVGGYKTYVVDVPEGKNYLIVTAPVGSGSSFYCYGVNGTTIKDDVLAEVLSDVEGMFLPADALDDYYVEQHGKNLIDWNKLLYGKYVSANKQTSHTNGVLTNPLYLENGKTYTFQNLVLFGDNLVAAYGCYDPDGNFLDRTVGITNTEVTGNDGNTGNGHQYGKGTFTYINQGEAFIRFDVQTQYQLGQTSNIQLEEGEEPTSIEPYSSEQVLNLATKQEVEGVNNQVKLVKEQIASIGTQNKLLNISLRFSNDLNRNIYTIMVMSKLSDNKNIAFKLRSKQYTNNPSKVTNLTLKSLYLGSDEVINAEGLCVDSNLFNEMGDSISPLNWVKTDPNGNIDNSALAGVPIFHQHGFSIARFMPSSTNPMTSEDVNSIWIGYDSSNNKLAEFAVGRVTTSSIYLVPQLTNDTEGSESLCFTFNDASKIKKIVHKRGGVYANDISGTSERCDLPIQIVEGLSFYADGNEVFVDADKKSVDIQCNEFKITQNILGKTPFGYEHASDWFEAGVFIPDGCHDFVMFTENYIFNGTCCTYNVSMNTLYPFLLSTYKFVQPMYMEDTIGGYNCKVFFPKAKRLINNIPIDKGFASTTSEFHVSRYADHLYDVNDMPDRSYAVLSNNEAETPYLVGLANGMSLNRGISIPSLKNTQIQVGSTYDVDHYCIRWARSAGNKVYYNLFTARGVGEGYNNRSINTNFVTTATGFFSIFDPNANPGQQVFWYKESDYWVLYAHAPELIGKQTINLPPIFEGMQVVETIEKTDGVTLLTTVVTGGKLYVKYEANANGQANFITMKLK